MLLPNNQNPLSPEYKQFRVLKIFSTIALVIIITGFLFGLGFIYHNIFKTLTNSESILIQKIGENIEVIEFEKLDRVMDHFHKKISNPPTINTKDPFFGQIPPSTTTTPN